MVTCPALFSPHSHSRCFRSLSSIFWWRCLWCGNGNLDDLWCRTRWHPPPYQKPGRKTKMFWIIWFIRQHQVELTRNTRRSNDGIRRTVVRLVKTYSFSYLRKNTSPLNDHLFINYWPRVTWNCFSMPSLRLFSQNSLLNPKMENILVELKINGGRISQQQSNVVEFVNWCCYNVLLLLELNIVVTISIHWDCSSRVIHWCIIGHF